MKKKLLCCALLAGFGMAQSAAAQSYDDRWYIGAGVGVGFFDNNREASDHMYGVLGLGKMITPNISIDAELWHSNPDLTNVPAIPGANTLPERNWELMSLSIVGRYHWTSESRNWAPYVAFGIGAQEHHDGTAFYPDTGAPINPAYGYPQSRTGTDIVYLIGLGATWDIGYPYLRTEIGARIDMDDEGYSGDDYYLDGYAGIEFLFPIGPEATPAPPPLPPPAKTCADLDDDGDGVNNCDDKCPGSTAGEAVGADGCPVPPPPVEEPKPFRG